MDNKSEEPSARTSDAADDRRSVRETMFVLPPAAANTAGMKATADEGKCRFRRRDTTFGGGRESGRRRHASLIRRACVSAGTELP